MTPDQQSFVRTLVLVGILVVLLWAKLNGWG